MIKLVFSALLLFMVGCQPKSKETISTPGESSIDRDLIYHYSIWGALVNGVFDGECTVGELKAWGDVGLGTYNGLAGELVMLDGEVYQVLEDGQVVRPMEDQKIPFAHVTWFEPDIELYIQGPANYDTLKNVFSRNRPSPNYFYAFRIHGTFRTIQFGSIHHQEKPYRKSLAQLIEERPVFEAGNIMGTMAGFFCPDFVGEVNIPGFHLHFISDDKTRGGHVMSFNADDLALQMDQTPRYQFDLPESAHYSNATLKDNFDYGR